MLSHNLFILLLKSMHTDLRTLKVIKCETQNWSQIDSKCCRPAEDKLTIQRFKIQDSISIYSS